MEKNHRYLWLAAAALLGLFVGTKWNLPLAAWIAPVFALRFFRDSPKAGRAIVELWFASAIPMVIALHGSTFLSQLHPAAEPLFLFAITPIGLIPYLIDRAFQRRFTDTAWTTLVFPVAVTAADYLLSSDSPYGTFGAAGYTQRGFLPAMQIAAVTGIWGITFIINWLASLVNYFWEQRRRATRLGMAFALLVLLVITAGAQRVWTAPTPRETVAIAGFSLPNEEISILLGQLQNSDEAAFREQADSLHQRMLAEVEALAGGGAEIIALQEGVGLGYSDQVDSLLERAGAIARKHGVYIVLPLFDMGKDPAQNAVVIIDADGEVALRHVKYGGNLFEGTEKGDEILRTVDTPYGRLSAVICWDADFPLVMAQAGAQEVDLLFVPSNDWRGVKDIHAGMATFRAVENGLSLFRQTGSGVSLAVDAFGRTYSRVDSFADANADMSAEWPGIQRVTLPVGSVPTLYPRAGDGFGQLMVIALALLLVLLWVQRKRGALHKLAHAVEGSS
ncbi:MAG: hypothetical protein KDD92_12475 [Caldilineaceae bacterium]|nr:hypothetical protein [Caldilineaceae bacterium]